MPPTHSRKDAPAARPGSPDVSPTGAGSPDERLAAFRLFQTTGTDDHWQVPARRPILVLLLAAALSFALAVVIGGAL